MISVNYETYFIVLSVLGLISSCSSDINSDESVSSNNPNDVHHVLVNDDKPSDFDNTINRQCLSELFTIGFFLEYTFLNALKFAYEKLLYNNIKDFEGEGRKYYDYIEGKVKQIINQEYNTQNLKTPLTYCQQYSDQLKVKECKDTLNSAGFKDNFTFIEAFEYAYNQLTILEIAKVTNKCYLLNYFNYIRDAVVSLISEYQSRDIVVLSVLGLISSCSSDPFSGESGEPIYEQCLRELNSKGFLYYFTFIEAFKYAYEQLTCNDINEGEVRMYYDYIKGTVLQLIRQVPNTQNLKTPVAFCLQYADELIVNECKYTLNSAGFKDYFTFIKAFEYAYEQLTIFNVANMSNECYLLDYFNYIRDTVVALISKYQSRDNVDNLCDVDRHCLRRVLNILE